MRAQVKFKELQGAQEWDAALKTGLILCDFYDFVYPQVCPLPFKSKDYISHGTRLKT